MGVCIHVHLITGHMQERIQPVCVVCVYACIRVFVMQLKRADFSICFCAHLQVRKCVSGSLRDSKRSLD